MGELHALLAGETLSPQEILTEALADVQAGRTTAVVVLSIDGEAGAPGMPGIACSAIAGRDLALLNVLFTDFVTAVIRDYYADGGEGG